MIVRNANGEPRTDEAGRRRLHGLQSGEYTAFFDFPGEDLSRETTAKNQHHRISQIRQDKFILRERRQWLLSADAVSAADPR